MSHSLKKYREEVRNYYKGYYTSNDAGHQIDHADEVCDRALMLNRVFHTNLNTQHIVLCAYIHDMYANNRATHHQLAARHILQRGSHFLEKLDKPTLKLLAAAVREHRASGDGTMTSTLSTIISTADKTVCTVDELICRSYKFNLGKPTGVIVNNIYEHIIDKFHPVTGYNTYSDMSKELDGNAIKALGEGVLEITPAMVYNRVMELQMT